jgi:hypothetical protein
MPDLNHDLISMPVEANKQLYNLPSDDSLALVHDPQNGLVIEEIKPISVPISSKIKREATSPS